MSEQSPRTSSVIPTLTCIGVLVIALVAVFFVGARVDHHDRPKPTNKSSAVTNASVNLGVVTSATASASATPDQLSFAAAVASTRSSTAAALTETNRVAAAISAAAVKAGVASKDFRTTGVSVEPAYSYTDSGQHLVGYRAALRDTIMVRSIDKAGATLGAVASAGGNAVRISNVTTSFSNRNGLIAEARTAAVKKSKLAAEALAGAAGRRVGTLVYVEEDPQDQGTGYYPQKDSLDLSAASGSFAGTTTPISPGSKSVSVTVQVRWSLK
ncbi:MAG: hypothetical protein JWP74_1874 [Marmoricola sp.]|nr:hypothetical protein [Marmoricola sp.]